MEVSLIDTVSDSELVARMPGLVLAERTAVTEVIVHLMEIDRRRLYLDQACSSLYRYAIERLGYSEDEAFTRVRVVRLAARLPRVLEALRSGAVHLTGLFMLSSHLTEQNADALLAGVRGKSRHEIEQLLASGVACPAAEAGIRPVGQGAEAEGQQSLILAETSAAGPASTVTRSGTGARAFQAGSESHSVARYRIELTASAEFRAKLEQARELVSHALPQGELHAVLERALDALIERELRRRTGAGRPRKRRSLKAGSRHVPLEIVRLVWERDGGQCTFEDAEGRRCRERRFLTLEHKKPFALGGAASADNICLLCAAHNAHSARKVFGEEYVAKRVGRVQSIRRARTAERGTLGPTEQSLPRDGDVFSAVLPALCNLGFDKQEARKALTELQKRQIEPKVKPVLRAALELLVPTQV